MRANERISRLLSEAVPPAKEPLVVTGALTAENILDALRKVRDNVHYTSCIADNRHVVHPLEWERGGLAHCANCGTLIDLGTR